MKDKPGEYQVLIGLGSNLDPEINLSAALDQLQNTVKILSRASVWQSPAVGHQGPDYLNTAVLIATDLPLQEIESNILGLIEDRLGRVRGPNKYMDRTIDLDVLVFDGDVIDPEIWTQAHAALPASEILPSLEDGRSGLNLEQTAQQLQKSADIFIRADLEI